MNRLASSPPTPSTTSRNTRLSAHHLAIGGVEIAQRRPFPIRRRIGAKAARHQQRIAPPIHHEAGFGVRFAVDQVIIAAKIRVEDPDIEPVRSGLRHAQQDHLPVIVVALLTPGPSAHRSRTADAPPLPPAPQRLKPTGGERTKPKTETTNPCRAPRFPPPVFCQSDLVSRSDSAGRCRHSPPAARP